MKSKKKLMIYICLAIVTVSLLLVGLMAITGFFKAPREFSTSNIDDYSTSNHAGRPLFPNEIPQNAKTKYNYYNYYNEDYDELLVLAFTDEKELITFVDAVFEQITLERLYQRANPYNSNYIEYLCKDVYSVRNDQMIQSLEYHPTGDISAHFHSINISYGDRIVVISYSRGVFTSGYIPAYLQYFNVIADETLKDIVFLSALEGET